MSLFCAKAGLFNKHTLAGLNCLLFGSYHFDRYWRDVLSGEHTALQPLEVSGFGERRLTGSDAYSPNRPGSANQAPPLQTVAFDKMHANLSLHSQFRLISS